MARPVVAVVVVVNSLKSPPESLATTVQPLKMGTSMAPGRKVPNTATKKTPNRLPKK